MYITDDAPHLAQNYDSRNSERARERGWVMPIKPFLKGAIFDPEIVSVMGTAFEDVWKALEASSRTDVTKEIVAIKIIQLARAGETHPIVLREKVLSELGLLRLRNEP
jgi:hypothetical protein